jgi:hypothetical protein
MYSQGGNHYKNDGNQATQLTVVGSDGFTNFSVPVVLKDCRYAAPANQISNSELENANDKQTVHREEPTRWSWLFP